MNSFQALAQLTIVTGLAVLACGCQGQDADHLARGAHRLAAKFEGWTGGAEKKLANGWQAIRTDVDQMTLDARIAARIRWDKGLEGAQVAVTAQEGEVELKGKVRDLTQRRRAVELAESTSGAEKVTDSLEAPVEEP